MPTPKKISNRIPDVLIKIHKKCKTTPPKASVTIGQTVGWEAIGSTFFVALPGGVFENQPIPFILPIKDGLGSQPPGGLKAEFDITISNYIYDVDFVNCKGLITAEPPEIVIGSGRKKTKKMKSA